MKKFTFLLLAFLTTTAFGQSAPPSIKGQSDTGYQRPKPNLQVPNKQATNLGGLDALIETGNTNILQNPSFEHSTVSTGWTCSPSAVAESTVVIDGKKSIVVAPSASAMECYQDSTLYSSQFADGVQGLAMVRVKTSVSGIKVCSRQAGTTSTTLCVDVSSSGTWGLYKVPFILGGTSNGISINSNGASVTGNIYIDDAFVGAVDLKQDVTTSSQMGSVRWDSTCSWNFTGAFPTYSSASADASCVLTANGSATAASTNIPAIKFASMPTGKYVFWARGQFYCDIGATASADARCGARISNGTLSSDGQPIGLDSAVTGPLGPITPLMRFEIEVTSPLTNTTFELQGAKSGSTNALYINATSGVPGEGAITVDYFPPSTSVYSSTNADTDWQSCGHTTSDFTGFGTVTNIETQCKRDGGDLLMKGKFTSGTTTAVEARVGLKFQGQSLTSKGTSAIPSLQISGEAIHDESTTAIVTKTAIEPSVGYFVFLQKSPSTTTAYTKVIASTAVTSGKLVSFTARIPISGWENSNVIIGSFNEVMTTPGITKPKTCYYAFGGAGSLTSPSNCTAGTCTEYYDSCGAISVSFNSTGIYDVTISNGTFAANSFLLTSSMNGNAGNICNYGLTSSNSSGGAGNSIRCAIFTGGSDGTLTNTFASFSITGQAP